MSIPSFQPPEPEKTDSRYEIQNDEIQAILRRLAEGLRKSVPPDWGFTLFLMSYGENGAVFYVSSIDRADCVKALKEFIAKEEASNAGGQSAG